MKSALLAKSLLITGLITLSFAGYKFLIPHKPADICQIDQLKSSRLEIGNKDKARLGLHMDFTFGKRVNMYMKHVKKLKPAFYFKQGKKHKPALVSLTTQFKSKKKAHSAYRYLKRKWHKNKKGQYDVALKDKEVTLFRNSHYQPQCFYKMVKNSKKEMGAETLKLGKKKTRVARKKKQKKRKVVSYKKFKKRK